MGGTASCRDARGAGRGGKDIEEVRHLGWQGKALPIDEDDIEDQNALIFVEKVTRVAPHFDASGEMTHSDFWLLFKMAGYDQGFQYSHTIKVRRWNQDDTYLIELFDDMDRRFHAELIMEVSEPEMVEDWKAWQKYKAENKARFEAADQSILEEHIRIAEEWE